MTSDVPKRIKLIVNKGQDLQLYNPTKTIKIQPRKWRVLFLGVIEKMATAKIESENGNPEWLCEITVTTKNSHDPISMLVTDSKGHHVGQVIIPLTNVPPKPTSNNQSNSRPPLLLSNLYKSELEPTKKNSHPQGYLYYWMWAEEYWQLEEINKLKIKKSLSRSMQNISSSTLNLFRRKKSNTSYQETPITDSNMNGGNPFGNFPESGVRASPVKVNQLKNLNTKSGSDTSASTYNSHMHSYSATISGSPMSNGYNASNPFENGAMTIDISIENSISQPERYDPHNQSTLSHETSVCSKESPVSNKKRHGLFNKFRGKKSKSSVDLNKLGSEIENRTQPILPQSLGKHQGTRLFEKKNDFSKSSSDITSWFCGDAQLQVNQINNPNNDARTMNRPQSCVIQSNNDSYLTTNHIPNTNYTDSNGNHHNNDYKPINLNRNFSLNSPADIGFSQYHNYDDMNKKELVERIIALEKEVRDSNTKYNFSDKEIRKLQNDKKALIDELSTVRDELCKLKCSLLEAGETKYLEKSREGEISEMTSWRAKANF